MLEMKRTGENAVTLWDDGVACGGAAWSWATLAWGRERVTVARLSRLESRPGEDADALWAYLEYLWEGRAVAAAQLPDGTMKWYHTALQRSWQAAGSPLDFT